MLRELGLKGRYITQIMYLINKVLPIYLSRREVDTKYQTSREIIPSDMLSSLVKTGIVMLNLPKVPVRVTFLPAMWECPFKLVFTLFLWPIGLVHWTQVLVLWVRIPAWPVAALVSLSKTLNRNCFVLRMGRKAGGPVCCVMHVKEPRTLIVKEKGLAPVFLDSRPWATSRVDMCALQIFRIIIVILFSTCLHSTVFLNMKQEPENISRITGYHHI